MLPPRSPPRRHAQVRVCLCTCLCVGTGLQAVAGPEVVCLQHRSQSQILVPCHLSCGCVALQACATVVWKDRQIRKSEKAKDRTIDRPTERETESPSDRPADRVVKAVAAVSTEDISANWANDHTRQIGLPCVFLTVFANFRKMALSLDCKNQTRLRKNTRSRAARDIGADKSTMDGASMVV